MMRTELTRRVAADPASVALLLSGPVDEAGSGAVRLRRLQPPGRAGVGFVMPVEVLDGSAYARGRLSIAPGRDGGTELRLTLTADEAPGNDAERRLGALLDDLVETAQRRSRAA